MLIMEKYDVKKSLVKSKDIVTQYGNGPKSEWRVFINKVLKHIYEPLDRWQESSGADTPTGVLDSNGEWHQILNRINTDHKVMSVLLDLSSADLNKDAGLLLVKVKNLIRREYKSLFLEEGFYYINYIKPAILRSPERKSVDIARDIMSTYGKGYNSDWRVFLNKALEYVYSPKKRWYGEKDDNGRYKKGVWTKDGEWHHTLNRINTNYIVMAKLIEEMGVDLWRPTSGIYYELKQFYRSNLLSILSEDGELYKSIVERIIGVTSAKGDKTEEETVELLTNCPLFNGLNIKKLGGSGVGEDMVDGVDAITYETVPEEITHTIQIKPFTGVTLDNNSTIIHGVGQAKRYTTDYIVFGKHPKDGSYIVALSNLCFPENGKYVVRDGGIAFQTGVTELNEDINIIRNLLKLIK